MIKCVSCHQDNHNEMYKYANTCDVCIDIKVYRYFGYPTQERGAGSYRSLKFYEQTYGNMARKAGIEWLDQDCIRECYHYTRQTEDTPDVMIKKVKEIIEKTLAKLRG